MEGKILKDGNLCIKRKSVSKVLKCPEIVPEIHRDKNNVQVYCYCNCGDFCAQFSEPKKFLFWTVLKTCKRWFVFTKFEDERS